MLELVVIADDLTGAADTSVQFCPFLKRVWLFPGGAPLRAKQPSGPTAWGVHTDSRSLSPAEAYLKNRAFALTLPGKKPRLIYKKVDSCMRGNVGVEVQALLEVLGKPCAFIAPAYPEMGRITLRGIHLIHGVPVAQSEMGHDPLSPVGSSRLEELVGGPWGLPVAHLDLQFWDYTEEKGLRRIEELLSKGVRHITFDALDMSHLRKIAHMALKLGALAVGSAGLAAALAEVLFGTAGVSPRKPSLPVVSRHLFVVGSKAQRARAQIGFLLHDPFVHHVAVPSKDCSEHEKPWESTVRIGQGCLLLTPEPPQDPRPDPKKITQALAEVARQVVESWSPQTLFLAGGETAQAVLESLGIMRIRLLGEPQPGIVMGKAPGGLKPGLLVLTKAGAFGEEGVMADVLQALRKGSKTQREEQRRG